MKLIDQIKSMPTKSGRIKIADVKAKTGASDEELLELQAVGAIVLYRLDNPFEITAADKKAAINLGPGIDRHILYVNSFK